MKNTILSQVKAIEIPEAITTIIAVFVFILVMLACYVQAKAQSRGMFIFEYLKELKLEKEKLTPELINWIEKQITLNKDVALINFVLYQMSDNEYEIGIETGDDLYANLWSERYSFKDSRGEERVTKILAYKLQKIADKNQKIKITFNKM